MFFILKCGTTESDSGFEGALRKTQWSPSCNYSGVKMTPGRIRLMSFIEGKLQLITFIKWGRLIP